MAVTVLSKSVQDALEKFLERVEDLAPGADRQLEADLLTFPEVAANDLIRALKFAKDAADFDSRMQAIAEQFAPKEKAPVETPSPARAADFVRHAATPPRPAPAYAGVGVSSQQTYRPAPRPATYTRPGAPPAAGHRRGIGRPSMRTMAIAISVLLLIVLGVFGYSRGWFSFIGIEAPVEAPAARALPADEPAAEPATGLPAIAPGEQPPEVALLPQEIAFANTCAGGYMTVQGMVVPDQVGARGYRLPSEDAGHAGARFKEGIAYSLSPINNPGWMLIQTESGAAFIPQSWFTTTTASVCMPVANVPGFPAALSRLALKPGLSVTLLDPSWWRWYGIGGVLVFILAMAMEMVVKKRIKPMLVLLGTIGLSLILMPFVPPDKQAYLYIWGLWTMYALGDKGDIKEVGAVRRSTQQVGESRQVRDFLDVKGFFKSVEWSFPAWYAGACLVWTLVSAEGSPLSIAYGPVNASIIYVLTVTGLLAMEALRRGQGSDWVNLIVATILGLTAGVLFAFLVSPVRATAVLITTVGVFVIPVLIGLWDSDLIDRDRLPEGIGQYAAVALTCLIVVVVLL